MFFKTRICEKFIQGTCPYGSNCNFAHGAEEVRKPPPNWKEIVASHGGDDRGAGNWVDQQRNIINRLRICRKFYFGEGCPYGEKCNFLHEDPERVRESTAVMVNTNGNWPDHSDSSVSVNSVQESRTTDGVVISVVDNKASSGVVNSASDGKPVYWKTKICNKWEMTGHCPFGEKCHFAHGQGGILAETWRLLFFFFFFFRIDSMVLLLFYVSLISLRKFFLHLQIFFKKNYFCLFCFCFLYLSSFHSGSDKSCSCFLCSAKSV